MAIKKCAVSLLCNKIYVANAGWLLFFGTDRVANGLCVDFYAARELNVSVIE